MADYEDAGAGVFPRKKFMDLLKSYQRGSISRRHFLGVTGLGAATVALGGAMPGLFTRPAFAEGDLGNQLSIATWPNYHNPDVLQEFTEKTGVAVDVNVFGSNEEMLAKLQAGSAGWSLFVATNYTISTYQQLGFIEQLELDKLSNYDAASQAQRFANEGMVDGVVYAIPKHWGTTGFILNTAHVDPTIVTWKEFWDRAMTDYTGRAIVHDYQLTAIGMALKYYGYSFNSVDTNELAKAEELLMKAKPHLFGITSDYQPPLRNGDAWMSLCWVGDAKQLNRDDPNMHYVLGAEGGEIWTDFFVIPKDAPHREAAYAFLNFLLDPAIQVREAEVAGYPLTDKRAVALQPAEVVNDPILNPAAELLSALEFGAAVTLTDPNRAEIIARFKSA
ncbi:spermidine/putrescine transport system substrate-binding protein [Mesorhizobium soli]|uniref:ABC transporter substrate-binding protein n=1 Tax=Pseudaminobacter soli (ex Li et al. 2025) TaxID=1295366 RepID=UPI002474387D|nr:spermidine/putrescine ABC transporter substrate-binding protein [Mesorhizobium soli]MDH6230547.1 spermidine/putrescine transport system substrate-binding protein [Mesorhizobium soli]